jgi:hypothetical protein
MQPILHPLTGQVSIQYVPVEKLVTTTAAAATAQQQQQQLATALLQSLGRQFMERREYEATKPQAKVTTQQLSAFDKQVWSQTKEGGATPGTVSSQQLDPSKLAPPDPPPPPPAPENDPTLIAQAAIKARLAAQEQQQDEKTSLTLLIVAAAIVALFIWKVA